MDELMGKDSLSKSMDELMKNEINNMSMEERMNRNESMEQMDNILSRDIRTAVNMKETTKGYDQNYYNVSRTEQEVEDIQRLLNSLDRGFLKVGDKELAQSKLNAIQGRNLSHLMLNDQKVTGDSSEMAEVKRAIEQLESVMTRKGNKTLSENNMDYIASLYSKAMDECQKYCDSKNPWTSSGKRRKAKVQATLKRLTKEAEAVELGRMALLKNEDKELKVTNGMELLSFAAVQKFTEKLQSKREQTQKEDLEKEKNLLQVSYDADQAEYNALYEKKKEEYGIFAFIKIPFDKDLNKLKEELDLDAREQELEDLKSKISELDTKKKEREKKKNANNADAANRQQLLNNTNTKISKLSGTMKDIANLLNKGHSPTELIKNPKKITSGEMKLLNEFKEVRKVLETFTPGEMKAKTLRISGKFVRFVQDNHGNLNMQVGNNSIPLTYRGDQLSDVISRDIIKNRKIYGDDAARDVISSQKISLKDMTRGELLRSREYSSQVLNEITGIRMNLMNNISNDVLRKYALQALKEDTNKDTFRKEFEKYVNKENEARKERDINTVLNLELQAVGVDLSQGVVMQIEQKEDESGWKEDEKKVRDLAADLLFSRDTWVADGLQKSPGERIRHVLLEHHEAIALLISDQFRDQNAHPESLVDTMLDKLPLFIMGAEEVAELKAEVKTALEEVKEFINNTIEEALKDEGLEGFGKMMGKVVAIGQLRDLNTLAPKIKEKLENLDKEQISELAKVDSDLDKAVKDTMLGVQDIFDSCVDDIFGGEEEAQPENAQVENAQAANAQAANAQVENAQAANAQVENAQAANAQVENAQAENAQVGNIQQQNVEAQNKNANKIDYTAKQKFESDQIMMQMIQTQYNSELYKIKEKQEELLTQKQDLEQLQKSGAGTEGEEAYNQSIAKKKTNIKNLQTEIDNMKKDNVTTEADLKNAKANLLETKALVEKQARKERVDLIKTRIAKKEKAKKDLEDALVRDKSILENKQKELDQKQSVRDTKMTELVNGRYRGTMSDVEIGRLENELKTLNDELKKLRDEVDNLKNAVKKAKDKLKRPKDEGGKKLEDILEDTVRGKKGQGLFMKNVFRTYFKSVSVLDQRSMIAGAIKNSKAMPKMTEDQKKNLGNEETLNLISGMIGGMFKGAGPLFQKMLQGIPLGDDVPLGLRKAIEDTMDNLAHIPDEIVKAHMDSIIGRSNGKVEKIEVLKSLGAASVGQAFLCKMYGPDNKEGRNVVIKLLRPDARNRMMREKQVMLNAARMTDEEGMLPFEIEELRKKNQIGGMEATYLGNLQRIEEELDLTKEADNCRKGAVYDKALIDEDTKQEKENLVDSMKLSDLADPTSDTCVMEIAGSKTVKRYISDIKDKTVQLLEPFCVKEKEIDKNGKETGREILVKNEDGSFKLRTDLTKREKKELVRVKDELTKLANDLSKRQQAVAQLAEKWVTEGVFEKGYYHGDLHAGNIMINEKGVTVIDFGNATELNTTQQGYITKMMVAACLGDVESFRHGFHALLENTPEKVYQEKREELTLVFKEVFSMGDEKDAAARIAVALARAQEIGLELPPVIANFSSCQMRLQNTLKDVNSTLKGIQNNLTQISDKATFDASVFKADPITKIQFDTKSTHKTETIKEKFRLQRRKLEVASKEEFLNILRNEPDKMNAEFGISDGKDLDKELDRIEAIVKGARPTKLEKQICNLQDIDNLFVNVFMYIGTVNDNIQKKYLENTMAALGTLIEARRTEEEEKKELAKGAEYVPETEDVKKRYTSLEEYSHSISANSSPELKEFFDKYKFDQARSKEELIVGEYLAEKNKPEPENPQEKQAYMNKMAQLENQIYDKFAEKQKEVVNSTQHDILKGIEEYIPMIFLGENDQEIQNEREKYARYLEKIDLILGSCYSNSLNGEELKKEGEKLIDLLKKCIQGPDMIAKYHKAMMDQLAKVEDMLLVGQVQMLKDLENEATGHEPDLSNRDPKDFLEVMGGVLSKYQKRVLWRLGVKGSMKLKKAQDAAEAADEEDD